MGAVMTTRAIARPVRRTSRPPAALAAGALALSTLASLAPPAAAQTSNTIDVTITAATGPAVPKFRLQFDFGEDVNGFTTGDLQLTNATVSSVLATGNPVGDLRRFFVDVFPAAAGDVVVTLGAGGACNAHPPVARCNREASFRWNRPVNSAPVITNPGGKTYRQGEIVTAFGITVTDADQDAVTVTLTGLPSGLSYSATTGQVSGTVAFDAAAKNYGVTISADDGTNAAVTASFTVTVTANSTPVITPPGNRTYARGETITAFGITVTDADDDALTVEVTGLPSGLSYSATAGQVSGTVASDAEAKNYSVGISATDGMSQASASFTVTVTLPPNQPPEITAPEDKRYTQGQSIIPFFVRAIDSDGITSLAVTGLPSGLGFATPAGTGYVTFAGTVSGTVAADAEVKTHTVTITASDGTDESTATFDVTVAAAAQTSDPPDPSDPTPANTAPVITDPGNKEYAQGEAVAAFAITVTDADVEDTVSVSVSGLPPGLGWSSSSGQVSGTVAADADAQDYTVTITADDGANAAVTLDFTVTVTAAAVAPTPLPASNRQPAITDPGDKEYEQGEAIAAFGITVTDADDDTVSVSVSGLPPGLGWSSSSDQVSGTVAADADARDYTVTITADDGVTPEVTLDFTVTVTAASVQSPDPADPRDPTPPNTPPVITDPGDKEYAQGEAIAAFAITATDADADDTVSVSVSGLPPGLGWSPSAGRVSGTVAADAAARGYAVTVTADDGANAAVTLDFTVTVTARAASSAPAPNRPPEIADPGDKSYAQGETIAAFAIEVTDADDDDLTVDVTGLPRGLGYAPSTGLVAGTVAANADVRDYAVRITATDHVNPAVRADFTTTITVTDEDEPGVVVRPTRLRMPVREVRSYTVALRRPPQADVTIAVRVPDPGVTVTPEVLAIRADDWDRTYEVRVSGRTAARATLSHTVQGGGYDGVPASDVAVNVFGDDTGGGGAGNAGNRKPAFTATVPPQRYQEGTAIPRLVLPEAAGGDGPLRYRLRPDPPAGLTFDPATRTLSGVPDAARGPRPWTWTATDADGDTASLRFTIEVRPDSRPTFPRPADPDLVLQVDRPVDPQTLPAARDGDPPLRYEVTPDPPSGLTLDDGRLSGAPAEEQPERAYTLTATDADGDTASLDFTIKVVDPPVVNRLRIVSRPAAGDTYGYGETIEVEAVFSKPVTTTGTPTLPLTIGETVREAALAAASRTTLRFGYTVAGVDRDADGVSVAADALALAGGRLVDAAGTDAELGHPALPDQPDHKVDGAPRAVGRLPAMTLVLGAAAAAVDASAAFHGAETWEAASSAPDVAAVSIEGAVATVTQKADGAATVTITGRNPGGTAVQAFAVTVVTAQAEIDVVAGALAGVGRSLLASASATIGRRMERGGGGRRLVVAGRSLPVEAAAPGGGRFGSATTPPAGPSAGVGRWAGAEADAPLAAARRARLDHASPAGLRGGRVTGEELLYGSAFAFPLGEPGTGGAPAAVAAAGFGGASAVSAAMRMAGDASADAAAPIRGGVAQAGGVRLSDGAGRSAGRQRGAPGSAGGADRLAAPAGGPRWTVWGAGDVQAFGGETGPGSRYDGRPLTTYLGLDVEAGRLLAGAALSHGAADADYTFHDLAAEARGSGRLATRLLNVQPYVRWALDERTDVWGIAGAGRGHAKLARSVTSRGERADLRLLLGMAGVRRELRTAGAVGVALRADAGVARLKTAGGGAVLGGLAASVHRTRVGLELFRTFGAWTPFAAAGGRYDGGAGTSGAGLELAGGLRAADAGGRFGLEARGRLLALHTAAGYHESGFAVTVRVMPAGDGRGPALELTPGWGAPATGTAGADTLRNEFAFAAPGRRRPESGSFTARVGYEFGLLAPFTELARLGAVSRQARVGLRLGEMGGPLSFTVTGERHEYAGGPPDHRLGLFGSVLFQ